MINKLSDVSKAAPAYLQSGETVISLYSRENEQCKGLGLVVAIPSWHVDFDYITWPAIGDHYDNWLANVGYGQWPPTAKKLKEAVEDWLNAADLSPLNDNDDEAGHHSLANSLTAAIKAAQGEKP